MEQVLLRIGLPQGGALYASRFRELLAREANLPPAFFHRSKGGTTIKKIPLIRVVGGRGWVGIVGDGDEAASLVEQAAGPAIRIVSKEVGVNTPVSWERRTLDVAALRYPERYFVRNLVIKRRSDRLRQLDGETLAREMILKGLRHAANVYGIEWSGDNPFKMESLVFDIVKIDRPRGLRLSTTNGVTNEFVTLMDVEFVMNRKLLGIWQVGNLKSRGYGRIGFLRQQLINGRGERGSVQ